MKVKQNSLYLIIVMVFIAGAVFGYLVRGSQYLSRPPGLEPLKPRPTEPGQSSASCYYGGKVYRSGEGFPSEDGCNNCSCTNGQVACTLRACE